jgi:hypothetical protein
MTIGTDCSCIEALIQAFIIFNQLKQIMIQILFLAMIKMILLM